MEVGAHGRLGRIALYLVMVEKELERVHVTTLNPNTAEITVPLMDQKMKKPQDAMNTLVQVRWNTEMLLFEKS